MRLVVLALLVCTNLTRSYADPQPVFVAGDKIRYASKTSAGVDNGPNADYFTIVEDEQLFVVANGAGPTGAAASKSAGEVITDFYKKTSDENFTWPYPFDSKLSYVENRLVGSIKWANEKLAANRQRASVVAALVSGSKAHIANVGIDRAYLIRDGKMTLISHDHTMLEEYRRDHRDAKPDELAKLPRKDVVTRALGRRPTVDVDIETIEIRVGDKLLLCSEGVNVLGEPTILSIIQARGQDIGDLEATIANLSERTKLTRKTDATVLVIAFVKKPATSP